MPPSRSKYSRCIGYQEELRSKIPKPRQPKKDLTEEEKMDAEIKKLARKGALMAKKDWEATLVPWVVDPSFRFPVGTIAMYKSDAKVAYSVSEKEILTLHHECIPRSSKTFFAQEDVKELARNKFMAGASKPDILYDQIKGDRMVFKKTGNSNVSRRKNFTETTSLFVMQHIQNYQKRKAQEAGPSEAGPTEAGPSV